MSQLFGQILFQIIRNAPKRHYSLFGKQAPVKDTSPYIIVRANKEDFEEILDVMHEGYYDSEPTISSLNISPNPVLDERAIQAMTEGFTMVAKCKYNGCIVGACINESSSPWDPEVEEKMACQVQAENIRKLLMFYAYMKQVPDLWRCLNVQKVYEMAHLFVKKPHRKKGLAYKLLEKSKTLGADAGFQVVRCDATSLHTAKICERLGMHEVAEIPYCSYLGQNLEPVFHPPWPHESVKIYCDCHPQYHELQKYIKKKSGNLKKDKE